MGIGRDLNHPPTKWEFMLQILNSSRCPEKKGNCPVLSTCFLQLRFGFLKLKLQLNYPQANQHKKWDSPRFPPKFLPIQLPLFPTCKAAADSLPWRSNCSCEAKKNCQVWQWISQVLFSKWQFLNWDFKKSDPTIFWAEKKNIFGTVQDCMPTLSNTLLTPKLSFHVAAQVCCAGLVASGGLVNLHITLWPMILTVQ